MKKFILPVLPFLFIFSTITGSDIIQNASSLPSVSVPVSGLKASSRNGQVFITWKEADTPEGTTFNVYVSKKPVRNVDRAIIAGHHIERHSARDWWQDQSSFVRDKQPDEPVGFLIENGGKRLDPKDGLFVYTLRKKDRNKLYFAVTATDPQGKENINIVSGFNTMSEGIRTAPGKIQPVWQRNGQQPEQGSAKGKSLLLSLHGKGSVVADMEYLIFGDETMGWRAGLPFKFSVRIQNGEVVIRPTDRMWINRPHLEAGDGGTPAIWTFWYGCNSMIYDRNLMSEGVPVNYTERRLIWILNWVSDYYQPDPDRWYCSGSSMGGCGTISFGLRHPELFAALHAHVPIVSYTYLGSGSAHRLEPSCWIGKIPADLKTNEQIPLLERMNGDKFVSETKLDLPFIFLINGRKDASIPWENNPPFYKAMGTSQQGFAAYWDNGIHSTSGTNAPEDVKDWPEMMHRFKLNESFPVFSNMSSDKDPGDGHPEIGDTIGWINRGIDWSGIEDTRDHYAITVSAGYPGLKYPVQTDLLLRRVQNFRPKPGEQLLVYMGNKPSISIAVQTDGRIYIPGIAIPSKEGIHIKIIPAKR